MKRKHFIISSVFGVALFVASFNLLMSSSKVQYSDLLFESVEGLAYCEYSGGSSRCNPETGKKCYVGELVATNCSSYVGR